MTRKKVWRLETRSRVGGGLWNDREEMGVKKKRMMKKKKKKKKKKKNKN